ncbi:MAG: hypothetical protein VX963_06705 [Actinomycetota bacterium]|jgi:uncharacterized cupin superfamily protein|nr:hypothetical protein [Acidimicrobiaceae bacterium]MEC7915953.1 hypothetical protein [Actinomycetota bacterium]MEC9059116.1 hypothetical protein [Actinomycetota bacterium]
MEFEFTQGEPITEQEALSEAQNMGLHAFAFDTEVSEDSELHWHEFNATIWLVAGEASFATEDGTVFHAKPGCRLSAPAGWLHQELVSPSHRLVIGTDIATENWTQPVDKPAAELSV